MVEISPCTAIVIGWASLVLSEICKQRRELCLKNIGETTGKPAIGSFYRKESEGAQFPTIRDNLEYFWDMISLPIKKARDGFASIELLSEENGWMENEDEQKMATRTENGDSVSGVNGPTQRKKPLWPKNDNSPTNAGRY